jgi:hypothetical protein
MDNNLIKIILPNNPNITEINNNFFENSKKIKTINFNNLPNLNIIGNKFLYYSNLRDCNLEKCSKLIEIKSNFLSICINLKYVKLPISIKIIEEDFLTSVRMPILDLENCINLMIINSHFCTYSILDLIKLPLSIEYIDESFLKKSKIGTVDLSNCINLKELKNDFAIECKLKLLKLPVGITKIRENFLLNSEIEILDLENCINLINIPQGFLKNCKNLRIVKLPPQLQHIMETLTLGN